MNCKELFWVNNWYSVSISRSRSGNVTSQTLFIVTAAVFIFIFWIINGFLWSDITDVKKKVFDGDYRYHKFWSIWSKDRTILKYVTRGAISHEHKTQFCVTQFEHMIAKDFVLIASEQFI